MNDSLKLLVVDSDFKTRKAIIPILCGLPDIGFAETVSSVESAFAKLKFSSFDLVLLDALALEEGGMEALSKLLQMVPGKAVVVMSARYVDEADQVVAALQKGALDYLPKPVPHSENSIREFRLRLLTTTGMLRSRKNLRKAGPPPVGDPAPGAASPPADGGAAAGSEVPGLETGAGREPDTKPHLERIDVVAIAASTGGPNALGEMIPYLQGDLGVPILLVQHMPSFMTSSLGASLDAKSALRVKEAMDGEEILPNTVYLAPGGKHMALRRKKGLWRHLASARYITLNQEPPENSVRPSADVLFRSIAEAYGKNILAVIMTGMGNDGMKGVKAMKAVGCYCLSQSMETCVVYGMPRAVDEAGLSDERVPLEELAGRINAIVKGRLPQGKKEWPSI